MHFQLTMHLLGHNPIICQGTRVVTCWVPATYSHILSRLCICSFVEKEVEGDHTAVYGQGRMWSPGLPNSSLIVIWAWVSQPWCSKKKKNPRHISKRSVLMMYKNVVALLVSQLWQMHHGYARCWVKVHGTHCSIFPTLL